jgi:hypothetical protein
MTYKSDIEKTEGEIKVLQAKLELLKEMEKHKSPVEEAYKRVYGNYPDTGICNGMSYVWWDVFCKGYNASKEEYKVEENPTPQEPKERKTLYQRFGDEGAYGSICFPHAVEVVRGFLLDEGVIACEDEEYITFTLHKSLLDAPND